MKKKFLILIFLFSVSFMFFSCQEKESMIKPLDDEHIEWLGLWENDTYRIEFRRNGWVYWYSNQEEFLKQNSKEGGQEFSENTLTIINEMSGKSLKEFTINDFPTEEIDDDGIPYKYITLNSQKLIFTN